MKNILVFAAHPDDELLGIGGTIRRLANEGALVRAVIMAEGLTSREKSRDKANKKELLAILGLMITQLGIYTSLFFIDKNDSPCHIFIVFTVGQFGYDFSIIESRGKLAGIIICLILILFFSLVFNEIIELRFFGLAYNTKRNITERAELEVVGAMIVDNDSDDKSEDSIEMVDKSVEYN